MKYSNKEKRKLLKNNKSHTVKHYLVLRDSVMESGFVKEYAEGLKSDINVGDNVVIKKASLKDFSASFKEAVLRSMQLDYKNPELFDEGLVSNPDAFLVVKNQDNNVGFIANNDLVPISKSDLSDRNGDLILQQNPYLEKSGVDKWFKKITFNPLTVNDEGVIVGSDRLKKRRQLFHYTTAQDIILSSKEWRMSHYKFEDDKSEFEYTFKLVKNCAKEIGDPKGEVNDLIMKASSYISETYLLSLTSEFSKKMWDEYGSGSGVAFRFDEYKLNESLNKYLHTDNSGNAADVFEESGIGKFRIITLNEVIYDSEVQNDKIYALVKDFLEATRSETVAGLKDIDTMGYVLAIYAIFFKDPIWKRQKEVRFAAIQNSATTSPQGYQKTSNYEKVPYIKFPLFEKYEESPLNGIYTKNKAQAIKLNNLFGQIDTPVSPEIRFGDYNYLN